MRDQQQNAKSAAIPGDPVRAREVRRRRLHAARTKAIDHTRLISRQPTRRRAPTAPRRPGFNRIRSDCRRVQTHYHRPAVDVEYPFPLSRTARPAVSPSINIASGRLSKALFDMSFAMINMCTGCSDRRARSDSVNQHFAPDTSSTRHRRFGVTTVTSTGRRVENALYCHQKWLFSLHRRNLIVCVILIGLLALQVVNFNEICYRYS